MLLWRKIRELSAEKFIVRCAYNLCREVEERIATAGVRTGFAVTNSIARAERRKDFPCGASVCKKASQSLPPAGGKYFKSFFAATCAWGKIPLRLPVWNFCADGAQIMRAADLGPFVGKNRRFFRQHQAPQGFSLRRFFGGFMACYLGPDGV